MVPLETVFVGLVLLFGLVGMLRGWAKELLVTFSVVLARFIELVFWRYVPILNATLQGMAQANAKGWFYVRLIVFVMIVCFGYATTKISTTLATKARKDKLQDSLLGFFIGVLNGYLIVGISWGFLADPKLNYQVWNIIAPTAPFVQDLVRYLPLAWLTSEMLFVAVALAFACVLIVFV